jgi:hypothetical protein
VVHRERAALLDGSLPRQPYHAAADGGLGPDDAAELIAQVVQAATLAATAAMAAMVAAVAASGRRVVGIGVVAGNRHLPSELSRILASHPLLHAAEGELFEQALIEGGAAAGLPVVTVAPTAIFDDAAHAASMTVEAFTATLAAAGRQAGPPWQKDHRQAAAAAVVALGTGAPG